MTYAIVVSQFNSMLTDALLEQCLKGFKEQGIDPLVVKVPGALEIPYAAQKVITERSPAAIVTLGAIVEGETEHYRVVCDMVSKGVMDLMLKESTPIIFEVLMADSYQKIESRVSKGYHAAFVATEMAELKLD